jgi:hypothetical protein
MKAVEKFTRWFVYLVGGAAALLIVFSIGRGIVGNGKASATDIARAEEVRKEDAARKAEFEADQRAYEEQKAAEDKALLTSLGAIQCNVTLKHFVKKPPAELAEAYRKQNLPISGEIVRYAEVYLRSLSTDQVLMYESDPDFRLSSESRSDEYKNRAFILLRPQAERCLAEFAGGQRNAQVGRSNISVGVR